MTAFTKKQQSKLASLEKNTGEKDEQIRLKQAQIETLQYELSSQTRRTSSEASALKQAIANLELELDSTRREADEYHKASIEKNSEVASLETKVSRKYSKNVDLRTVACSVAVPSYGSERVNTCNVCVTQP